MAKTQKLKKGNKHATNSWRRDRKYKRVGHVAPPGNCGSSFCTKGTGCDPWHGPPPARIRKG